MSEGILKQLCHLGMLNGVVHLSHKTYDAPAAVLALKRANREAKVPISVDASGERARLLNHEIAR